MSYSIKPGLGYGKYSCDTIVQSVNGARACAEGASQMKNILNVFTIEKKSDPTVKLLIIVMSCNKLY